MLAMLRQSDTVSAALPKLLVVDDDMVNSTLLQRLFEREYTVICASCGSAALEVLDRESIDLVLLDLMMPDVSGYDILEHIRSNSVWADLPVIIISAKSDNSDVVRGLELGAHDYIAKPIQVDIVRARVQTQLALKRLADEHKRTIHDLQIAQQMQDTFYRIVSHDLKGPLTNLRMAHFLLRDIVASDEQGNIILDNIELTLDEMHDMIRVFLDVMTLQPGRMQIEIDCLSTNDVLQNVAKQYALTAESKNIILRVEPAESYVMADNRLLSQMISNLVSNAVKFSMPETVVTLWATTNTRRLRLYVSDQGPGIPVDERDKLFEMFSRLSTRPTASEHSTGLGLWIVKQLAEAQNGRVGVECPADGGSIFWIELPACST
jgi:two-component system, sensor histidine kinase and response regulator